MRHLAPTALLLALLSGAATATDLILPDLPPWAEETADDVKKGLAVDIAAALQTRSGLPLTVTLRPMPRQIASLRSDDHSFAVIGLYQDLPDEIVVLGKGFDLPLLAIAGEHDPAPTPERLRQLSRVGVVHGGAHLLAPGLTKGISFVEIPDVAAGLKMLEARRIDALMVSSFTLSSFDKSALAAYHLGAPQLVFTGRISLIASAKAASSADGRSLAAAWDEICGDGTVARILASITADNRK